MTSLFNNGGFTLIELLVVVLIIGILAAIALPQYQLAVEKSRATEAITTMANIQKGLDLYLLEKGLPSERVYLVGSDADSPSDSLPGMDFDYLTCDVEGGGGGTSCRGGDFAYQAACGGGSCSISTLRCPNGQCATDLSNVDYMLSIFSDSTGILSKFCLGLTSKGARLCAHLPGWN